MLNEVNYEMPDIFRNRGLKLYVVTAEKLPEKYIDQLIRKSRQPHVLEFEGDEDARGRFKDREAFYEWQKGKTRIFYLLLDQSEEDDLAAVLWFGERDEENVGPDYNLTFGIRFYEGYVGGGLAKPTMKICHKDVKRFFPDKKFWLSLHSHNEVAKHVYQTFGYKIVKQTDDKIFMVENFNAIKVVVIGGGNGTSVVLSALSSNGNYDLSGVISMADDGGSTGRLRNDLGVSAVGDIRQSLALLSENKEYRDLINYRFSSGKLEGHSFGNMLLAAGELTFGNIEKSIKFAADALNVEPRIIPCTLDKTYLFCKSNDSIIKGVYEIANTDLGGKPEFYLDPKASINPSAKKIIEQADLVLIAPGNFYCSITQSLIVDGMIDAIKNSSAKVVMISNLVNIDRHCKDFSSINYAAELERIVGDKFVDIIVNNIEQIDAEKIKTGESMVVSSDKQSSEYKIIGANLVDKNKVEFSSSDKISAIRSLVKHDKKSLAKIVDGIISEYYAK